MEYVESHQQQSEEPHGLVCDCCGDALRPRTAEIVRRAARTPDEPRQAELSLEEKAQQITGAAWSEAARELSNLLMICSNCHRALDGGTLSPAPPRRAPAVIPASDVMNAASELAPTDRQLRDLVRVVKAALRNAGNKTPGYVIEYSLLAATFVRLHEVAQCRESPQETSEDEAHSQARSLAVAAARSAQSAAVELRQTYLCSDPQMSMATRNAAVAEFGGQWLGWRSPIPDEKLQALIDALLSDQWPSEERTGDDDVLPSLRKLIHKCHMDWRPIHKGRINRQTIVSTSVRVHGPTGESAELIELIPAPAFEVGSRAAVVRRVLAELSPIEQEICLTYADCPGRRSWKKAAQLNGQPEAFGQDRVRRKILRRFVNLQASQPVDHRATGR
ncbi:hypothetical protein [Kutzneria sp. NPDC052558]|uniref:hypothetical protein n=1 Tax=Kutzneria sp. NPDC052558 TaxID=3364121 RepID=UPI0037CB56BA